MKIYHINDFAEGDAWLICRIDSQVKNTPIDIYMVMNLPGGAILSFHAVENELSQTESNQLLQEAKIKKGTLPRRIIMANTDPAEFFLKMSAEKMQINFESMSAACLEDLTTRLKQAFCEYFSAAPAADDINSDNTTDEAELINARKMIPDSYDPCPCASGKKYKFCCKKIFSEIMEAMVAAEEGRFSEALGWINKAKKIVGETAEVLCREAIVYSFFDLKKSDEIVDKCLAVNSNHPRAHYLRGITYKMAGNYSAAIKSYETAISCYPPSDHFHLNEVYVNLGNAFYDIGELDKAKTSWEKALLYLPSDKTARENLAEFIYKKPIS